MHSYEEIGNVALIYNMLSRVVPLSVHETPEHTYLFTRSSSLLDQSLSLVRHPIHLVTGGTSESYNTMYLSPIWSYHASDAVQQPL